MVTESEGMRLKMAEDKAQQEPSMEEILASIRKIISEDVDEESAQEPESEPKAEPESDEGDDVLELTQMVQDDGTTVELKPEESELEPEPEPEPELDIEPEPELDIEPEPASAEDDRLISDPTASSSAEAFANLAQALEPKDLPTSGLHFGSSGRTIEELLMELMRPMLREWLDTNLPAIVERLVERELRYIIRRSERD